MGGVENHVHEICESLKTKRCGVTVVSQADIKYLNIKYIGLISIWIWLFENRDLIKDADIVHCQDVFIWYLPFVFLYPNKRLFLTIHGWEEDKPFSPISLFQKRLAVKLSTKTIGIGAFLQKYLKVKFDLISYGAARQNNKIFKKNKNKIVYVGRLEKNTGLLQFLDWLNNNPKYKVDFCGDGPCRSECEKYGTVHGFTAPDPFYKKAKYAVPGGYLAALEALSYGCELKLFWNNNVKEDYWKMSPFYKLKGKKLKEWAKKQTWEKLADEYIELYNSK